MAQIGCPGKMYSWCGLLQSAGVPQRSAQCRARLPAAHCIFRLLHTTGRSSRSICRGSRQRYCDSQRNLRQRGKAPNALASSSVSFSAGIGSPKKAPASVNDGPGQGQTARQPSWYSERWPIISKYWVTAHAGSFWHLQRSARS